MKPSHTRPLRPGTAHGSFNSHAQSCQRSAIYAGAQCIRHPQLILQPGVLVECDPSIKAIILKIDQDKHDYIVEDLDDQTLMIKESQLPRLKARLEEV